MGFNTHAASCFERLAQMLELTGANRFRINAHARAARLLKDHPSDLEHAAREGDKGSLTAIDGVGESTADKLIELARTGSISELDTLGARVPEGLMDVLEIQGLGPKSVRLMWEKLGVESVEDLKRVLEDGTLADLPRMGAKTIENIRESIAFLESSGSRLHIGVAQGIGDAFVARLEGVDGVERVAIAGSLRRGKETIGDIDLLVVASDPSAACDAFVETPGVTKVLARGATKSSIRCAIDRGAERWGASDSDASQVQVDMRVVDEDAWGAAMMYFTGSKEHNVRLRERAGARGMTLNEYGLFEDDGSDDTPAPRRGVEPVAGATEAGIYAALGLPEIPPALREDRGEFALAETPDLVSVGSIVADLHTHTTDSDGSLTLEESARIAARRGFHTLAITDHSRSSRVANGLEPERLREQIRTVRAFNEGFAGVEILCGSEVDIHVDGTLDYDDDLLAELDVVVASPHAGLKAKPAQATKRLIRAIEHPLVHIIGHPTGRLIERRPGLEPAMDEVIAAAHEHGVALEVNAHWMRLDLRDTHVRAAVERGCLIAIDCDVHRAEDYDNIRFGVLTAQRGWCTKERCINTWSKADLHAWLRSKR